MLYSTNKISIIFPSPNRIIHGLLNFTASLKRGVGVELSSGPFVSDRTSRGGSGGREDPLQPPNPRFLRLLLHANVRERVGLKLQQIALN